MGHLVSLGHQRIAMIRTYDAEGLLWPADLSRTQGYVDALVDAGLPTDESLLVTTDFGAEGGIEAMQRLLALPDPPTAVFAHSDEVAFGVLRACRLAGVRVPEDLSVVGVDDHPMAALQDLTTVHQPVLLQGRYAGEMLLEMLRGELDEPERLVPTTLVVRGTTGPPPSR